MHHVLRRGGIAIALAGLVAGSATGCLGGDSGSKLDPTKNADAKKYTLTLTSNAIADGKNAEGAKWIEDWVIPRFEAAQKKKGITAHVKFQPNGVDDADYKSRLGLDLEGHKGADVMDVDGIWVGEFAESNYIRPLKDVVGDDAMKKWKGWDSIADNVQKNASYQGKQYGVPQGTDGRVIYFNKKVFAKAGLSKDWQPRGWKDILDAAKKIKQKAPGVTPVQLNAGTAMGESSTMEGFLPLLAGAGSELYQHDKWQGDTKAIRDTVGMYSDIYQHGLGDPTLQKEAKGREKAQQKFADGKVGIMFEGDYLWRDVISPKSEVAPMKHRDSDVGFAKIPAIKPAAGVGGQNFVSMSGGAARVINPNTKYPQQAWELMQFMSSAAAVKARVGDQPSITERVDVNKELLKNDPMLSFVSNEVIPITRFRPPQSKYLEVSTAIQEATYAIADGKSEKEAVKAYQDKLKDIVGAKHVASD
jgi:multiple sugar transport system substrate-binding protein